MFTKKQIPFGSLPANFKLDNTFIDRLTSDLHKVFGFKYSARIKQNEGW